MNKKQVIISTKTGDKGLTGLISGERLNKDELVFEVVGSLDELSSWLGLIVAKLDHKQQRRILIGVQQQIFIISGIIAKSPQLKFDSQQVKRLEKQVEKLRDHLSDDWQTKFVYPGGIELGGELDIARTVCRRAERRLVSYGHSQKLAPSILKYFNRLSDYLYVLRCFVNDQAEHEENYFESKKK